MERFDEKLSVSVVVPVYKGAKCLRELYRRTVQTLTAAKTAFEIIFVEDGSPDSSWDVIKALACEDSRVRGIKLSRNFGQHNALLCGIRHACYDVVVTLDDDLQNPPEEIPNLIRKLAEGYDVVYGVPERQQHKFMRNIASKVIKQMLQKLMGIETACMISPFRAFRQDVVKAFASYQGMYVSVDALLTWGGSKFEAIALRHDKCHAEGSTYSFGKLIRHTIDMITGFSVLPLQLVSMMGFSFSLFGLVVLAFVVGRFLLQGTPVPGFPFLASIISIFSGVQLFSLGMMGEYLARMHFRLMQRPAYHISSDTRLSQIVAN